VQRQAGRGSGMGEPQTYEPTSAEFEAEIAALKRELARQAAEIGRLKQVCCPWQAYGWHRWPH
jgi:hypothetical protein